MKCQRPISISIKTQKTYDLQDVSTFNIRRIKIDMMNYCMHIASSCVRTVERTHRKLLLCSGLMSSSTTVHRQLKLWFFSSSQNLSFSILWLPRKRIHFKTCQLWFWFLVHRARKYKYLQQNIPIFSSSGIHKHRLQFLRISGIDCIYCCAKCEWNSITSPHRFNCSAPHKIYYSVSLLFICALIRVWKIQKKTDWYCDLN